MAPSKSEFWTNRMLCKLADLTGVEGLCFKQADFILQSREVSGQFMFALTQSIMVGLLFAFPYFFWEIWRFVKPGLKMKEAKAATQAPMVDRTAWATLASECALAADAPCVAAAVAKLNQLWPGFTVAQGEAEWPPARPEFTARHQDYLKGLKLAGFADGTP